MKRILFCIIVLSSTLTGCRKVPSIIDYWPPQHVTNYIYVNNCSSEISIHSYATHQDEDSSEPYIVRYDYAVNIPVNEEFRVTGHHPIPWVEYRGDQYSVISNGEKMVTQNREGGGLLYLPENYTIVREEKYMTEMEYVFTDEFFEYGEIIK